MSGEREIRDTADALNKRDLRHTEVLLYARLSNSEQNRVFQPHSGRRIVLATNVAETSLTVPGIKYVIDPVLRVSAATATAPRCSACRLSRFPGARNQRKGRCGRVSEGICIRLYSEDDFLSRPEFTDPEILRTNLASVILQMTALGWAISPRSRLLKRRINAIFRTACVCWKSSAPLPPTSRRRPIS
jgi:ATP-dependent helicase HrpA